MTTAQAQEVTAPCPTVPESSDPEASRCPCGAEWITYAGSFPWTCSEAPFTHMDDDAIWADGAPVPSLSDKVSLACQCSFCSSARTTWVHLVTNLVWSADDPGFLDVNRYVAKTLAGAL